MVASQAHAARCAGSGVRARGPAGRHRGCAPSSSQRCFLTLRGDVSRWRSCGTFAAHRTRASRSNPSQIDYNPFTGGSRHGKQSYEIGFVFYGEQAGGRQFVEGWRKRYVGDLWGQAVFGGAAGFDN